VNSYLDYLEGAFLVRRLPSFQMNVRKRLVKTPKVFWRDSGLLHALLRADDTETLLTQPWVGASWEGFVIEQVLSVLAARGARVEAFFFRTSDRHEIDLVLAGQRERWAVEIKLTTSPAPEDLRRLDATADMIQAKRRFLLSQASKTTEGDRTTACTLDWFLALIAQEEPA
jgi:predicted AAA+ superfamily ATPase